MGTLHYGHHEFHFDDRTLVHLQIVIGTKLRRQESFLMSWQTPPQQGSGRVSIWVNPGIPMVFTYQRGGRTPINKGWVDALLTTANSSTGLVLFPEPQPETGAAKDESTGPPRGRNFLRPV